MRLKDAIEQISGLRFIVERMPLLSSVGRRFLYAGEWTADRVQLEACYDVYDRFSAVLSDECQTERLLEADHLISQVRDIEHTVDSLAGGMILGDIEFFELKSFALLVGRLRPVNDSWNLVDMPSLAQVVEILDPEHTGVSAFHIYDIYSGELARVRARLKSLSASAVVLTAGGGDAGDANGTDEALELYQRSMILEDAVRKDLASRLRPLALHIRTALHAVARWDIVQAMVRLAADLKLTKPKLTSGVTRYRNLFNPQVADALMQKGRVYQPVDIEFAMLPTLISGINMGGKTVCLKTLALAQTLCQFGFYVPAEEAGIVLVNRVMLVMDDRQSDLGGLSSFAGEMRQVDEIIRTVRRDANVLVLIDELARTTNPVEGRAIVEAMLQMLADYKVRAFVSSHYDNILADCRRLRVKGLRDNELDVNFDASQIDRCIDYSLVPDTDTSAPHEALRIARLIGIDSVFVGMAEKRLR